MRSKLDPLAHTEWHEYYRMAARRRREGGWHRRSETTKPRRTKLDPARVLAIVMGLATVTVLLCLAFPS